MTKEDFTKRYLERLVDNLNDDRERGISAEARYEAVSRGRDAILRRSKLKQTLERRGKSLGTDASTLFMYESGVASPVESAEVEAKMEKIVKRTRRKR